MLLLGKIQSLRTSYREEVRKVKKSEGTGSGASDIYVPKWKHFEECSFLEDVIMSNHPTLSNVMSFESPVTPGGSSNGDVDEIESETKSHTQSISQQPKRKKKSGEWMETAASALSELAKGAATCSSSTVDDEWEIFGRDVANSIRGIKNKDLQRCVKFAVQTAIFQTTEQALQSAAPSNPYTTCFNSYHEQDNVSYHNF